MYRNMRTKCHMEKGDSQEELRLLFLSFQKDHDKFLERYFVMSCGFTRSVFAPTNRKCMVSQFDKPIVKMPENPPTASGV